MEKLLGMDPTLWDGDVIRTVELVRRLNFVYVADCKLATEENLLKISAWHGRFVTVMPRTWKQDEQFRESVRQGNIRWRHISSRKNHRRPESKRDRYYLAEGDYTTPHGYRLHWIRSTQNQYVLPQTEKADCQTNCWHPKNVSLRITDRV